jgi:hypothetical protein
MTIKKKKDEDKFSKLFTLSICKHDYDYIVQLANDKKTSIRKTIRSIINNYYKNVESNKEQK